MHPGEGPIQVGKGLIHSGKDLTAGPKKDSSIISTASAAQAQPQ